MTSTHPVTGDLVVTLSVTRPQLDSYLGLEGPAALLEKLTKGPGVRELVRNVLTHQKRNGLRRYGKKRGGR